MDFSGLDNNQLLELLKAAMAEATNRGLAMQRAAADTVTDAEHVARIKAEATQRALAEAEERRLRNLEEAADLQAKAAVAKQEQQAKAQKIAESWAKQKAIAVALDMWGVKEDWQINLWNKGADERVYVDGGGDRTYVWKITFFVTGNDYEPPNTINAESASKIDPESPLASKEGREIFKRFLLQIKKYWNGLKVTNTDIAKFDGEPNPRHLAAYLKALGIEEVSHVSNS